MVHGPAQPLTGKDGRVCDRGTVSSHVETARAAGSTHGSCSVEPAPMSPAALKGRAFKIGGVDCADEVATLKPAVGPVVGGHEHLAFDVLNTIRNS